MKKKPSNKMNKLQEHVKTAEEAVKIMTDPNLKSVAFKTILQSLLDAERPATKKSAEPKETAFSKSEGKKQTSPTGPKGRIEQLIEDGFFSKQRTISEVQDELANRTWFHKQTDLNPTLQRLVRAKALRRVKAPEKPGGKLVWRYSNW